MGSARAVTKGLNRTVITSFPTIDEGLCVQIMHIGSFDNEPATVALMDAYLEQNVYIAVGTTAGSNDLENAEKY